MIREIGATRGIDSILPSCLVDLLKEITFTGSTMCRFARFASVLGVLLCAASEVRAQGLYLPGGGAAHMSMAGASSARPVDGIGALYWNPASIGLLGHSEAAIGGAFLFPEFYLESTAPGPNGLRNGRTRSDSGVGVTTNIGLVHQPDEGPFTYGLGLNTISAGSVNYPGDLNNPILSGVGPLGNLQGPIASTAMIVQMQPTVAYKVTDKLVFGFGPTVDVAITSFDPAYFGSPNGSVGVGPGSFPTGSHSRPFWGGGLRAGLAYSLTDQVDLGFGYTSPQWFETWKYYARDELGLPRTLFLTATLPAIYSWGVSYRPTEKLLVSLDLRYFDYASTDLYGTPVRDGGLGWKSVFSTAIGARYQATDRVSLSAGYSYNDNPIQSPATLFNIQAPLITQNMITVGSTVQVTDAVAASLGYAYGFQNSINGPIREATGVGVGFSSEVHLLTFTLQFRYGSSCCRKCVTPADYSTASTDPVAR